MKSDSQLELDVIDEIKQDPSTMSSHIGVIAVDGVVTLTGTVATFAEKMAVERAAQRVTGGRGIAEGVTVKSPSSLLKSVDVIDQETIGELAENVWMPAKFRINRFLLSGMIVFCYSGITHA